MTADDSPDVEREPYLTVTDVAAWLDLSESAIRDGAAHDRLPATRVSGVWRFLESEVRDYLRLHHDRAIARLVVVPRHGSRHEPTTGRRMPSGRKGAR